MKILFISPSAGDSYYCGNCFRDALQAKALIRAGHDVTVVPLYLPMMYATEGVPIFFPAVSYYLEEAMFKKGNMPAWLYRFASSKLFLGLAASLSGTTSAEGMEAMTMSMITGADGAFRKNLSEMIAWIKEDGIPDIIHLSSTLLIGIAAPVKEALGVPVVCSVQDEEVWIDSLKGEWSSIAWEAIREHASSVDAFVTCSEYYRKVAADKMNGLSPAVIYPGTDIERYSSDTLPSEPTIGFFYRMNDLDGLDILAKAFVILKGKGSIENLKLRIGGGFTGSDKKFLSKVLSILKPFTDDVILEEDYSPAAHHKFYRNITVLSVPLRFNEGVGLYVCEAFAAGRPVVEPERGSFPETVSDGGILYKDESPEGLAAALERILSDKELYESRRANAIRLAKERYSFPVLAGKLEEVYRKQLSTK